MGNLWKMGWLGVRGDLGGGAVFSCLGVGSNAGGVVWRKGKCLIMLVPSHFKGLGEPLN